MDPRLEPLAALARLNTRLLHNCLDGVDDRTARRRASDVTNHLAFLGAHLVGARAYLAGLLGGDGSDPFEEMLGAVSSIDEATEFPTVAEIRTAWDDVSARLLRALEEVGPEALAEAGTGAFPIDDPTLAGTVAFLMQHDSYHIGQMALLRKHWGLGAMSYEAEAAS